MALTPVVLALSRSGEGTAHRIAAALGAPLHGRAGRVDRAALHFPDALSHIRDLFAAGHPVIGVCAAGILIRAVAPLVTGRVWTLPRITPAGLWWQEGSITLAVPSPLVIETPLPTKWYKDEGGADKSLEASVKVVEPTGRLLNTGIARPVEVSVTLLYEDDTEVS